MFSYGLKTLKGISPTQIALFQQSNRTRLVSTRIISSMILHFLTNLNGKCCKNTPMVLGLIHYIQGRAAKLGLT